MTTITKSDIKLIKSLSVKKFRAETGLFTVEGEKMVREALESGFELVSLWRRDEIGEEAMARISNLSSPSPVLAVLRQPAPEVFSKPERGLCIGLDSVRDPGNLGTILRIADWFGVSTVYAGEGTVETFNPKVIQSSMGSIFRVKVINCNLAEVCNAFSKEGREVVGTFLGGESIYSAELSSDSLLVMGNEADGIGKDVASQVCRRITIPSFARQGAGAESLNVAVATAVCLSEFRRRI